MYELTETERKSLAEGMAALFNEYEYRYTDHAINTILDEWATKKEGLITLFKKHPNYVEGKFLIALEKEYSRSIESEEVRDFFNWLCEACAKVRHYIDSLPAEVTSARLADSCFCLPDKMFHFLLRDSHGFRGIIRQFLTAEDAAHINEIFPTIKAAKGQKTSRVVNKICNYLGYDKHPDYNKEFAKYADALSPLTKKIPTILSVNPIDYLTMSFGNSWSSCHTIDVKNKRGKSNGYSGMCASGTISYLLDASSFVLYTVNPSYTGTDYFMESKVNRQMYHYGEEKMVQGRLYPQANDGLSDVYTPYREIAQEVMATCLDLPNKWNVERGTEEISGFVLSCGTHYRDYTNFESCTISFLDGSKNRASIHIGHNPICIECGKSHTEKGRINCCHQPGEKYYTCADCGAEIDSEHAISLDGKHYCRNCVSRCERCGEYVRKTSTKALAGIDGVICENCVKFYVKCEECGKYEIRDRAATKDGKSLCSVCYPFKLAEEGGLNTSREPRKGDYVLIRPDLKEGSYYGGYGRNREVHNVACFDMPDKRGKVMKVAGTCRGQISLVGSGWNWVSGMFVGILPKKPEGFDEIEEKEFPF